MRLARQHLFAIHLLTASGAAFALLAVMSVAAGDWNQAFVWLGVTLIVDGIDGPLARRHRVRERLPQWDGAALDFVVDYTTYVFVPAVIMTRAFGLSHVVGAFLGIVIAVTGALYFADTRMKQADNSFRGFPAVWNGAVFILYVFMPPPAVTIIFVVALAILTFLPVNFVHPVRVVKWRGLTLTLLLVWFVAAAWALLVNFQEPTLVRLVLLVSTLYMLTVAGIQQFMRKA